MIKRFLPLALLFGWLGVVITGCTQDSETGSVLPENRVTFHLNLPAPTQQVTRSGQTEVETQLDNVYVLLFKQDGSLAFSKEVTSFDTETEAAKMKKTFKVTLPTNDASDATDKFKIVLLGNVKSDTGDADNFETKVKAIDDITDLDGLTYYAAANPAMPIPMESVAKDVRIEKNMSAITIDMVRMVARVDVKFNTTLASAGYTVKTVYLYNYNTRGNVWSGLTTSQATATHIPTNNGKQTDTKYGVAVASGQLYAFEAAVTEADATKPCIVVELEKDGVSIGHYRADFKNGNEWLSLIRNHRYIFTITKVNGNGFPDPDVAYKSIVAGLDLSVIDWDDNEFEYVEVYGNYYLSVSQREFFFSREARNASSTDNLVTVKTNFPDGWKVTKITDDTAPDTDLKDNASAWIQVDESSETLRIDVSENSGVTRNATILIEAGEIPVKIKVEQTSTSTLGISVMDHTNTTPVTELVFYRDGTPVVTDGEKIVINTIPDGERVDFIYGATWTTITHGVGNNYTIALDAYDGTVTHDCYVTAYISVDGVMASQKIRIVQLHTGNTFTGATVTCGATAQTGLTFEVTTDLESWTLADVEGVTIKGYALKQNDNGLKTYTYTYDVTANSTFTEREFIIDVTSGDLSKVGEVKITQEAATPKVTPEKTSYTIMNSGEIVVKVTSNAPWKFEDFDTKFSTVVSAVEYTDSDGNTGTFTSNTTRTFASNAKPNIADKEVTLKITAKGVNDKTILPLITVTGNTMEANAEIAIINMTVEYIVYYGSTVYSSVSDAADFCNTFTHETYGEGWYQPLAEECINLFRLDKTERLLLPENPSENIFVWVDNMPYYDFNFDSTKKWFSDFGITNQGYFSRTYYDAKHDYPFATKNRYAICVKKLSK